MAIGVENLEILQNDVNEKINEENNAIKDEDVVAVGSISNVLRRAFRDFYSDEFDAKYSRPWQAKNNAVQEITQEQSARADNADNTILHSDDMTMAQNEIGATELNQAKATLLDHPYLVYGQRKMKEIEDNLNQKCLQASQLIALLDTRRTEAERKDDKQVGICYSFMHIAKIKLISVLPIVRTFRQEN